MVAYRSIIETGAGIINSTCPTLARMRGDATTAVVGPPHGEEKPTRQTHGTFEYHGAKTEHVGMDQEHFGLWSFRPPCKLKGLALRKAAWFLILDFTHIGTYVLN